MTTPKDQEELAKAKWNAEADEFNQWNMLSIEEQAELIANEQTTQTADKLEGK